MEEYYLTSKLKVCQKWCLKLKSTTELLPSKFPLLSFFQNNKHDRRLSGQKMAEKNIQLCRCIKKITKIELFMLYQSKR